MRNSGTFASKRITMGIIGLVMLVIVLFSSFYIASEANHDCRGEDCPICFCIQQCENTLRGVGSGITAQAAVIMPFLSILFAAAFIAAAASSDTLVSRKVRLND